MYSRYALKYLEKSTTINDPKKALDKHGLDIRDVINLCGGFPPQRITELAIKIISTHEDIIHIKIFTDLYEIVRSINFDYRFIDNSYMHVYKPQQMIGTNLFLHQVKTARSRKMLKLKTVARATDEGDDIQWWGYYCWGRLGYQMMKDEQVEFLRWLNNFNRKEKTLHELLATIEGRQLWKNHGYTWRAEFHLDDESETMNNLRSYLQSKNIALYL
ncbi:hypothetical protein [Chitinophaga nivalis]|uniref:Uncharacterized protein n=1 Tax=Chitinophaga nivalis TaxID=2991709 RepID=A0ABT3IWX6_9BACT|nr:hypothetical protein [Chitinophaga nivalis]MCW3461820.1 hypothetical protein [Chitinophaga nivalis]MCW3488486.1 hypothetical protein [Chitinophaga nivalis]